MRTALLATGLGVMLAAGSVTAASAAEDTPKHGGILTYLIPAEAPPSFDGHREVHLRHDPRGGAVLQRADARRSGESVEHHQVSSATCARRMPTTTDGGKTFTFKICTGVHFHDGSPLTAQPTWRQAGTRSSSRALAC